MQITFLIPAYNEAGTIAEVLDRIAALGLDYEAIVVDDGSTDETAEIVAARAERNEAVQLLRKPNGGKGSALRHGIPHCRGDIVVIQDADMEYDPGDVPELIEPIQRRRPTWSTARACRAAGLSAPTCSGTWSATGSSRC